VLAGSRLAGKLLEKKENASNLSLSVYNLSMAISNLNGLGLWGILRPLRKKETAAPHGSPVAPKTSFN
jgi:hypothetical protein